MSRVSSQSQPQSQPSLAERSQAFIAEEEQKAEKYVEGEMGSEWVILLVGLLSTLLFVMVVFYLEYVFFNMASDTGGAGIIGAAAPNSFFASNHGLWFYLFAILMIMGAAAAFGFSYVKNEAAMTYTVMSSAMLSLIFFLGVKNLTDQATKASFWTWVTVSCLAPVVLAGYGWWSLRSQTTEKEAAAKKTGTQADKKLHEAYASRTMWTLGMAVTSLVGAAGTFAGFYSLSPALTFEPTTPPPS